MTKKLTVKEAKIETETLLALAAEDTIITTYRFNVLVVSSNEAGNAENAWVNMNP